MPTSTSDMLVLPPATVLLEITGDLTSGTVVQAHRAFLQGVKASTEQQRVWHTLRVDLTHARMVDSVGLNFLVSIIKRMRAEERGVELVVSHPSVIRALSFSRLDSQVTMLKAT